MKKRITLCLLGLIVFGVTCIHTYGAVTLDATTSENFGDSFVAMIKEAEESGDFGAQDLILLKGGLAKIGLKATAYATQRGGPNGTPNQMKIFAAEYVQKYQGLDAKKFIELMKNNGGEVNSTQEDSNKEKNLAVIFDDIKKSFSESHDYMDLFSFDEKGAIYERVRYDTNDLSKPVTIYKMGFKLDKNGNLDNNGNPDGIYKVYKDVIMDKDLVIRDLSETKSKFKAPFLTFHYKGEIKGGKNFSNYPDYLKGALKFKDKLIEWTNIAKSNNIEKFQKIFPGEEDNEWGYRFDWDGETGRIITKDYAENCKTTVELQEIENANDFFDNFNDMKTKASSLFIKAKDIRNEPQNKINNLFQ
jgi:hypothetical protein